MLSLTDARRLGAAAGENTATGAFQRIEQAIANFRVRNDASEEEVSTFRTACEDAFDQAVATHFAIYENAE